MTKLNLFPRQRRVTTVKKKYEIIASSYPCEYICNFCTEDVTLYLSLVRFLKGHLVTNVAALPPLSRREPMSQYELWRMWYFLDELPAYF